MHVENALTKVANELHVIHPLVTEMAGVVVKTKAFVPLNGIERTLRRGNIKCNFGGVHLQGKIYSNRIKSVEDRCPTIGKIGKATLNLIGLNRGEGIEQMPYRGTGKTIDHHSFRSAPRPRIKEFTCRLGSIDHFGRSSLTHAFRIAIPINFRT